MSAALQQAIIAALRVEDPPADLRALKRVLGETMTINSLAALGAAVQSLRYQGKVAWGSLTLSPSQRLDPQAGPDDEEDSGVNDLAADPEPAPVAAPAARKVRPGQGPRPGGARIPGGWTKAANAAGVRPAPAPEHEPEIARLVREEGEEAAARRRTARSTGSVRTPLELKKFGVKDLSFAEGVQSLLAENPNDLMAAISRKHIHVWRRILLLARARGERPAVTLYAVLEAGLVQLEPQGELQNVA